MSSIRDLNEVATALQSSVGPAVFTPVVTRVLLRTGVSIRSPRPDQVDDPVAIARVVAALADMGYRL